MNMREPSQRRAQMPIPRLAIQRRRPGVVMTVLKMAINTSMADADEELHERAHGRPPEQQCLGPIYGYGRRSGRYIMPPFTEMIWPVM